MATAGIFGRSLTDKTSTSGTTPEQWGSDLTITGYDGESGCRIIALLSGARTNPDGFNVALGFSISLDGGSSFTSTLDITSSMSSRQTSVNATDFHPLAVFSLLTGDVTGDIVVRAMRTDAVAGSQDTVRGYLSAIVVPAGSGVKVASLSATDKTSFAGSGVEDWGSETATISGLSGVQQEIVVLGDGYCQGPSDSSGYSAFVALATDGTTFTTSQQNRYRNQAGTGVSTDRYHLPVVYHTQATPTGNVVAKMQAQSAAGAPADMVSGRLILLAVPSSSTEFKVGYSTLTNVAQGSVPDPEAQWGTQEAVIAGLSTPHDFLAVTEGERNGFNGIYVSIRPQLSKDAGATQEASPGGPNRTRIANTVNGSNSGALVYLSTWSNLTPSADVQARTMIDTDGSGPNTGVRNGVVLVLGAKIIIPVTGTMAATLGGLTGAMSGAVVVPVTGTMSAALGGLTATATGTTTSIISGTMAANLGGLSGTIVGTRVVNGTMTAGLGGLTAAMSGGTATLVPGTMVASFGRLAGTITAVPFDPAATYADLQPSLWSVDLATNLALGSLEAADLQPSLWRADLQP